MRFVPQGISGETSREAAGEIVLKHHTEQGDYYESQSDSKASAAAAQSAENLLNESSPLNPSVALPFDGIGNPPARSGAGAGSGDFLDNPSQPRGRPGKGTKTKFFDIKSQGNSFVFVIDRSASMNHSGRLVAAKADLLAALGHLKKTNQFQIIFYNSGLTIFRPRGNRPFFADEPTMELARRFVNGITADGPTDGF
ncbi:MAG: hypothetical protein IIA44_08090, partial [Acidobacteria bacterium]|nr:hypothetical protein [Acidobacteriota bacterium]